MTHFFNRITLMYYRKHVVSLKINKAVFNLFKKIKFRPITSNKTNTISSRRGYTSLAACGLFTWDQFRISNQDVKTELTEILKEFTAKNCENTDNDVARESRINFEASRNFGNEEWTKIYDKKDLLIWRRKIGYDSESSLDIFEHKVLGRIEDITPIEYYQVQIDLEYRKEWDYLVKTLVMVDKDLVSNTELVRWISKFPYPLKEREYMFVRRYCIEPDEKILILLNRGLPELSSLSYDANTVKVTQYKSHTIIIPYTDFDKPGLYYIIQYYEVNKANIPKVAYKWIASSGLPDYVAKLHKATLKLRERQDDESEKNFLDTFEFVRVNEKSVQVPEPRASESEVLLFEGSDNTVTREANRNNIVQTQSPGREDEVQSSELKVAITKFDQKIQESMPQYLKEITQKLYEDFFINYEPHPIFFNY